MRGSLILSLLASHLRPLAMFRNRSHVVFQMSRNGTASILDSRWRRSQDSSVSPLRVSTAGHEQVETWCSSMTCSTFSISIPSFAAGSDSPVPNLVFPGGRRVGGNPRSSGGVITPRHYTISACTRSSFPMTPRFRSSVGVLGPPSDLKQTRMECLYGP